MVEMVELVETGHKDKARGFSRDRAIAGADVGGGFFGEGEELGTLVVGEELVVAGEVVGPGGFEPPTEGL